MLRIGVSSCFMHADPKRAIFKGKTLLYLVEDVAHWLLPHGVLAYLIPSLPSTSKVPLAKMVGDLDGLVLQGGADVAPQTYGETPLKPEWSGDPVRDRYEIELVNEFVAQGKPVLGLCRGLQLLNVAYGGTLFQDIQTQVAQSFNHRDWEIYDQNFHEIEIDKGSWLSKLYGGITHAKINSVHHQAVKDLGKGLVAEAHSHHDRIVEAIRAEGGDYVVGVQWHPEFQDPKDKTLLDTQPLLNDFLEQAKKRKK
jgi:putative glutamine amidotransferase